MVIAHAKAAIDRSNAITLIAEFHAVSYAHICPCFISKDDLSSRHLQPVVGQGVPKMTFSSAEDENFLKNGPSLDLLGAALFCGAMPVVETLVLLRNQTAERQRLELPKSVQCLADSHLYPGTQIECLCICSLVLVSESEQISSAKTNQNLRLPKSCWFQALGFCGMAENRSSDQCCSHPGRRGVSS